MRATPEVPHAETQVESESTTDFDLAQLMPELRHHVHAIAGRLWLVHPLLDVMTLEAKDHAVVNQMFRRRAAQAAAYEREGDWFGYVMCHDRPLVIETFLRIADRVPDGDYWQTLRQLILTVGDCSTDAPILAQLLTANRPGREQMMTARERAALERMPDPLEVFRISEAELTKGWNWRLSQDQAKVALHVSRQHNPDLMIATGKVGKSDVIAYLPQLRRYGDILADPSLIRLTDERP